MAKAIIARALFFLTVAPALGQTSRHNLVAGSPPTEPAIVVRARCYAKIHNRSARDIYPDMSRRLGEEGNVILLLTVAEDGHVKEAKVQVSSGHVRLDQAEMKEALSDWRFLPGTINGKPTEMLLGYRLTFRLDAKPTQPCEGEIPDPTP